MTPSAAAILVPHAERQVRGTPRGDQARVRPGLAVAVVGDFHGNPGHDDAIAGMRDGGALASDDHAILGVAQPRHCRRPTECCWKEQYLDVFADRERLIAQGLPVQDHWGRTRRTAAPAA